MLKSRVLPVLALVAVLSLTPFAQASATESQQPSGGTFGLMEILEAEIVSVWEAVAGVWADVGPRMDENG